MGNGTGEPSCVIGPTLLRSAVRKLSFGCGNAAVSSSCYPSYQATVRRVFSGKLSPHGSEQCTDGEIYSPRSSEFFSCGSLDPDSGDNLSKALLEFKQSGATAMRDAKGKDGESAWFAAYKIVEALLLGVEAHLPEVHSRVSTGGSGKDVAIDVSLLPAPLLGEFATRSRIGSALRLASQVSFQLEIPPAEGEMVALLHVKGVSFVPLDDCAVLREHMLRAMGEGFTREEAFDWWEANKEDVCPLASSKFRWCVESLLDNPWLSSVVGRHGKETCLWGFLHSATSNIIALELWDEGKAGIRVTAQRSPPEEHELHIASECDSLSREALMQHLQIGDVSAPSSFNFLRLLVGRSSGINGASPDKIAKLLSAAKSWGPGSKGWQKFDRTWTCTDKRGEVPQGRVIWNHPRGTRNLGGA